MILLQTERVFMYMKRQQKSNERLLIMSNSFQKQNVKGEETYRMRGGQADLPAFLRSLGIRADHDSANETGRGIWGREKRRKKQ